MSYSIFQIWSKTVATPLRKYLTMPAKATKRPASKKDSVKVTTPKVAKTDLTDTTSKYFNDSTSTVAATGCVTSASVKKRLGLSFYDKSCKELAVALLGQTIVTVVDGKRLAGKIVETEAYLGLEDKAAHSYNGKRTPKTEAMFMPPGTAYVYNIYGMYCCLNISSQGKYQYAMSHVYIHINT